MELYPSIDLRAGRVVRLVRGDYDAEIAYAEDPVEQARAFARAGARWVHVVDLDAALTGQRPDLGIVKAICDEAGRVGSRVQVGGGVRDEETARELWSAGADRVVLGTAAVESPDLVSALAGEAPGRVAVGLDARGREVATRGWTTSSGADVLEIARRFDLPGVGALVVTSIARDGTMEGPDLDQLTGVLGTCAVDVVASGGVGTLDDVRALAGLRSDGRSLAGAIIGRALYERRFTLEEALEACSQPG